MSPSIPIINDRTPFSVTKSATKDPTQGTGTTTTTKKKKYTVLAAAILSLSSVGLTGFSVARYTSSSGGRGDNGGGGGGGIRASVDTVDGLLLLSSSSVDLRGDCTCIPATGTWDGKSFQSGESPYETCYTYGSTGKECWSKSYYSSDPLGGGAWKQCIPSGNGWKFLNSGAATSTCGGPCQQFDPTDDDTYPGSY